MDIENKNSIVFLGASLIVELIAVFAGSFLAIRFEKQRDTQIRLEFKTDITEKMLDETESNIESLILLKERHSEILKLTKSSLTNDTRIIDIIQESQNLGIVPIRTGIWQATLNDNQTSISTEQVRLLSLLEEYKPIFQELNLSLNSYVFDNALSKESDVKYGLYLRLEEIISFENEIVESMKILEKELDQ